MNRKEFYQNLFDKGIKDPAVAKQYEQKWIDSGRSFEDSPQGVIQQQPKPGNGVIQGIKDYAGMMGENVPQTLVGVGKGAAQAGLNTITDLNNLAQIANPISWAKGAINAISGKPITEGIIDKAPQPKVLQPSNRQQILGEPIGDFAFNLGTSFIPIGGKGGSLKDLALNTVEGSGNKIGDVLENTLGKTVKGGELKITNQVAKKAYGKDLADKKQTIINDIAEFGVTKGNHEEGATDALLKAQQRFDKADEITTQLAKDPNTPLVNPVEVAKKGISLDKVPYGKRDQVQSIIDGIVKDMQADGLDQTATLDKLIEAKRNINLDGKTFNNGPASNINDALEQSIRKKMYLNLVDAIGEISPEIKAMNMEGKRLLDVHAALTGAASREANHNAAGLTDWILGGASIAHPGSLAVTAPIFITKKALGGGRLGNMLINSGRALQGKTENTIEKTLSNLPQKTTASTKPSEMSIPENLDIPTFKRKGIDLSKISDQEIEERSKRLRITPEKYKQILDDLTNQESQVQDNLQNAFLAKKSDLTSDVYLENLPKAPVISIDRLRTLRDLANLPTDKTTGDIAAWHKLTDNYVLPDYLLNKPKTLRDLASGKNRRK